MVASEERLEPEAIVHVLLGKNQGHGENPVLGFPVADLTKQIALPWQELSVNTMHPPKGRKLASLTWSISLPAGLT